MKKNIGRNVGIGILILGVSILGLLGMGCEIDSVYLDSIEKQIEEDLGTGATYKVTYNGNGNDGGTAPTDETLYSEGQSVTVKGQGTLSLTGATFTGWNTLKTGDGIDYIIDSTFLMPASNVDLYAQWTFNPTYTVSYVGTGSTSGDPPEDQNTYETGSVVTVLGPNDLEKTGNSFSHWNTKEGGDGTSHSPDATFVMGTADVVLHSQWTACQYIVSFNAGGGSTPNSISVTYGLQYGTMPTSSRDGYSFNGWFTEAVGGTQITSVTTVSETKDHSLYAQWSPESYSITYYSSGESSGSVPSDSNFYSYQESVTVLDNTGNLVGEEVSGVHTGKGIQQRFLRWNTQSDGFGNAYEPGDTFDITENTNLYAVYTTGTDVIAKIGPAGGWVFYYDGSASIGSRYLEAAPTDQSSGSAWINGGPTQTTLNGNTSLEIGTGFDNSQAIVVQSGHTGSAAQLCLSHSSGGASDWFLPSRDELHEMYTALAAAGVGNFPSSSHYYWSSSEKDNAFAWGEYSVQISGGFIKTGGSTGLRVRAVRMF